MNLNMTEIIFKTYSVPCYLSKQKGKYSAVRGELAAFL